MEKDTLNFWNKCHIDQNGMGLTGSQYDDTINFLKINDYINNNIKLLEFGVGMGFTLRELNKRGVRVSGVDVSEIALECVKSFCENTYIVDDIDKLPTNYFDIIIYYNVVQHIPTNYLINEFKHSLRSLKNEGLMAIQFTSSPYYIDAGLDATTNQGQTFFRTKEYMETLINNLGGTCDLVYDSIRFYSPKWLKTPNDSGYGKIEYSSEFVTIPLPHDRELCPVRCNITGNHVFHVRKKIKN